MTGVTAASTLAEALTAALAARGGGTGAPVVVGHAADPLVAAVQRQSNRVVLTSGASARLLVGCGVTAAGPPAVVVVDAGTLPPREPDSGVTAVARDPAAAETLRRAGWTVAQPVWPSDVEPLLAAAERAPEAVVLRLHERTVAPPRDPFPDPELGSPRVLAGGRTGVVIAAGALVAGALAARPALAARGLDLAVVDVHTRRPQAARSSLAEPDDHVLVGGPQAAAALAAGRLRAAGLQSVGVPAGGDLAALLSERVPLHG